MTIRRLVTAATQIVESVLAVGGIRVGTEEPPHTSERLTDRVEFRRYRPRIAAETVVDAEQRQALEQGFRRLAGYIFGGNQASNRIAMTAPVSRAAADGRGWTVRFFMPSTWTMATLPTPDDARVRLTEVPAETMAVLRFSGLAKPDVIAAHTAELQESLRRNDIEMAGEPVVWFYDPPWTLPFRRRNEVAVPIES
jgi:SOUL heme-binding protein